MNFGQIIPPGSNEGRAANMHELVKRVISLTARCPKASKLMLRLQGETAGTQFRFARQGKVSVTLSNALFDGRPVELAHGKSIGAIAETFGASVVVAPGEMVVPVTGGVPVHGSVLSVQVEIRPEVPVAELRTRDAKTLEGNLSFQVRSY